MREKVAIVLDRERATPEALKACFAEIFASLDASPRPLLVTVAVETARDRVLSLDFEAGEPVFRAASGGAVRAPLRGRWLPEHPVPLNLSGCGRRRFVFLPTTGNRVKVRPARFWERWFS